MAKKSLIARGKRKAKLIAQGQAKRQRIKAAIVAAGENIEERIQQQTKLDQMKRDSSRSRLTRRCRVCQRPKAVYRKFGLCRMCLRKALMAGEVPGGRKSSW